MSRMSQHYFDLNSAVPASPASPARKQSWLVAHYRSFMWDYRFYRGLHPAVYALHMAWREARKPAPF